MNELAVDEPIGATVIRAHSHALLGRKSAIVKRSIELHGHKTSVSLEDEFWEGLRLIAEAQNTPLPALLQSIDAVRGHSNLSSAIRVYVFEHHRATVKGCGAPCRTAKLAAGA